MYTSENSDVMLENTKLEVRVDTSELICPAREDISPALNCRKKLAGSEKMRAMVADCTEISIWELTMPDSILLTVPNSSELMLTQIIKTAAAASSRILPPGMTVLYNK